MAEVTQMEPVNGVIPPQVAAEPPKRPRGRPRKEEKPVVQEEPEAEPLEELSGAKDFWLNVSNYTDDDWRYLQAYLYRLAPKIDRKSSGQPAHIQLYVSPFTQEDIMKEHGSGLYQIYLNRTDPASGKSFRVAVYKFPIINVKYPPVVPPGDWVDDKINENWKWGAPAGMQTTTAAGYPPGFNMDKMHEREEKMFERGLELAKTMQPAAKDDGPLMTLMTTLINANLNRPEPPKPDDTATKELLRFLEKQNDRLADEIKELRTKANAPAPPPPSLIEQIKDLKPMVSEFAGMFADRKASNGIDWGALAEKAIDSLPDVIELVKSGQNSHQYQPGAQPQQNFTPQLATTTTVTAAQQTNGQPPAAAAQPELSDEQKKVKVAFDKWGPHLQYIMPFMVDQFKVDEGGCGGFNFRDWYLSRNGDLRWKELGRELGPELLLMFITQHPFLQVHMAPPERAAMFVADFFTVPGEEKDLEEPPEPPAVATQMNGETVERSY